MGTDVHVVLVGAGIGALDRARAHIAALEARWSRFVDTSEVSRLNAHAGAPVVCSNDTVLHVQRALDAWRATGGRFDPTVLGAVRRAGYDASFDALPASRGFVDGDARGVGASDIVVDPATNLVMLPNGAGFDPGGIGKGLAADLVCEAAIAEGARGACVNIGGDLRVIGETPDGGAWAVDVLDPFDGEARATVAFAAGAVATSSRTRRTWSVGGETRHHLVDPVTQAPVANDVAAVTVVAREGWRAEVLAKGAFVAGVREGLVFLDEHGAAGAAFDVDGGWHESRDWHRFAVVAASR
jgi:thiamine biosynthesis lipoprotein